MHTVILFIVSITFVTAVPLNQLYPFGTAEGDLVASVNDDGATSTRIQTPFPFFGSTYATIWIETNGVLTFNGEYSTYTPTRFPLGSGVKMVATYWADVDTTRNPGRVYYREVSNGSLLNVATGQIRTYFPGTSHFNAKWLFIATWYNVTFFGGNINTPTDTFQCVLVTDGYSSYAIYSYVDITWTTGTASGGDAQLGLGGTPAQVGFDAGDGVNFYAIPQSRTSDVVNVDELSNLNPVVGGRYIFQINDQQINNTLTYTWKTCTALTDPHFQTFDGYYYSPQPPTSGWWLAAAPVFPLVGVQPWAVYFTTTYWPGSNTYTCINQLEIEFTDLTITFGMNGKLQINGIDTVSPWYFPNQANHTIAVQQMGTYGHLLTTSDMRVSFTGESDYKMVIQVPLEIYGGHMTGYCGNFDNNPNNDGNCPTGNDINHCYPWQSLPTVPPYGYTSTISSQLTTTSRVATAMSSAWTQAETTTARPVSRTNVALTTAEQHVSETTSSTRRSTASDFQTTTTSWPTTPETDWCPPAIKIIVDAQCEPIINNTGPFQQCIEQVPDVAQTFFKSCEFDLCAIGGANDTDVICNYLASFAAACMQEIPSLVLKWRSAELCPPSCAANMHYDDCASSCPDTCGDPHASVSCPLQCSGQCACDSGFVMDGGKCIPLGDCGCTDSNGNYHKNGTSWVLQDCIQECKCSNDVISCAALPPCASHATCSVSNGRRACFCDEGYTGDAYSSCVMINYCASNPCENGATCESVLNGYTCRCPAGVSGANCESVNPCYSNPCENEGTCISMTNDYICVCPVGTSGSNCEYVDHCRPSNPCQNGGTCVSSSNGYSCQCPPQTTGLNCGQQTDPCASAPCPSGQICHADGNSYTCEAVGTIDCTQLPNGNYADPAHPCAQYYFTCSNGNRYTMPCPANLYYNQPTDQCLQRYEVPACN